MRAIIVNKNINYRNTPLSEAEKAAIVDSYLRLGNQTLVAADTHHSCRTVNKVLRTNGYTYGRGGNQSKQLKITDEQLLEAVQTMTRHEIADAYGVHIVNIDKRMRKLGVHAIYSKPKRERNCPEWHFVQSQKESFEELHPGFEYLETFGKSRVRLKCRKCGKEIERALSTVRRNHVVCENCNQEQKMAAELSQSRQDLINVLLIVKEAKTPKRCAFCGATFFSQYSNKLYCSDNCKAKSKKAKNGSRRRCRKYGTFYDNTIKREEILERDKYTCQICGKRCNPNDKRWGSFGPDYPTIDHIVPIARGGKHIRENLQCACAMCNSYKRDLLEWEDEIDARVIRCG